MRLGVARASQGHLDQRRHIGSAVAAIPGQQWCHLEPVDGAEEGLGRERRQQGDRVAQQFGQGAPGAQNERRTSEWSIDWSDEVYVSWGADAALLWQA